jgi:hypothetical protein
MYQNISVIIMFLFIEQTNQTNYFYKTTIIDILCTKM